MRDGGAITEQPDRGEPTVEFGRDATRVPAEPARTRSDLPQWRPDTTRQDLPGRRRDGEGSRDDGTSVLGEREGEASRDEGTSVLGEREGEVPRDGETSVLERPRERADRGAGEGPAGGGGRPRRRSRWRWVRRVVYLLLVLIIGTPLFAGFRVWYVARQDDHRRSDAIIVLGAAQYNGKPSAVLEWRLTHALKLYREGVAPHIVTVGGNRPGDNYTEAGTGKAWLNEHGVPNDRIVAVRSGSDTLQSMIDVGKEYKRQGWHTAVIVTDPWHALRSRTMADDNGIKAVTSPTRSGPTVGSRDTQFHYIVRETGGYLWYVFIGRWHGDS
ncbi:YdcF family protein [Actinoallomurus rhizosphaericola]|uniref:YdcF family protein n=1 Tax=Actinoallomurus rhizosphaericola TaxID=2952536 RepID=UPI0020909D18|nr:YdcF family protein [Actinoallomurus rhizosphaericola]MCO5992487.1 YdcF family protein [Actinoallomurus rhizosphaericola]